MNVQLPINLYIIEKLLYFKTRLPYYTFPAVFASGHAIKTPNNLIFKEQTPIKYSACFSVKRVVHSS